MMRLAIMFVFVACSSLFGVYLFVLFSLFFPLFIRKKKIYIYIYTKQKGATDREKAKSAARRIFELIERKSDIDPLSTEGEKVEV